MRTYREFKYTNSDGDQGFVEMSYGQWEHLNHLSAPIMIQFDEAPWMSIENAEDFVRWLKIAISEAKRNHASTIIMTNIVKDNG